MGGEDLVLRLCDHGAEVLGIDRTTEEIASRRAAAEHIAPPVVAYLADVPALVTRWLPGGDVPLEDMRTPVVMAQVAAMLRRLHATPALPSAFAIFRLVEEQRALADGLPDSYDAPARAGPSHRGRMRPQPPRARPGLLPQRPADRQLRARWRARVHRRLGVRGDERPLLRPRQPVGQQRLFEADDDRALLELYWDEPVTDARFASLQLFRIMSDFREAMWGVVQLRRLEPRLRLRRLRATSTSGGSSARRPTRGWRSGWPLPRPRELPDRARVVIVGGGVGGTSIAYHLAALGERDVVLVDRAELTSGSTFHSAGLVGQLRGSVSLTRMMMDSVELYRRLGDACGWVECGGLRLACTPEREEELHRQVGWSRTFGLPLELLSADEAAALFPLMSTDGVRAASYLPTDGYLDPSQLTYALAEGAREGGCRIFTHTRVTAIDVDDGRVRGVQTEWGPIEAEVVVNAGGMFAAEIGRMAGVRVPVVPFAHEYLVTQPFRERDGSHLPTLRDPDLLVYYREEGGGLVMGGYERHSAPWSLRPDGLDAIAPDFNGILLEEDWDRFEEIAVNSRRRVPAMEDVKVTRLINGPEGFTPDNEFCLGESEVRGFFVAAGFCAHGLAGAGGIGKAMAEWIVAGEPAMDLWEMDVRRFGAHYRSPSYTLKRTREVYETYYDIKYPGHERKAGRPLRVSSAYAWHRDHGAAFGEKSGWERVNWYESNAPAGDEGAAPARLGGPAVVAGDRRRARRLPRARGALRRVVVRQDRGRAARAPRRSWSGCATTASRATSAQITYTQMLNARGGIECDFTVTRVEEELFSIVTGTAFGNHDLSWIRRNAPARRVRARQRRDRALGVLRALGPARPRRARAADARPARLRLHDACATWPSATCRCARCA